MLDLLAFFECYLGIWFSATNTDVHSHPRLLHAVMQSNLFASASSLREIIYTSSCHRTSEARWVILFVISNTV